MLLCFQVSDTKDKMVYVKLLQYGRTIASFRRPTNCHRHLWAAMLRDWNAS